MSDYRAAESEFRPLGISSQTINALVRQDICSLRDLSTVTERELARMPGIGPAALKQLRIYVRKEGPTVELHDRRRVVSVIFEPKALTEIDAWAVDNDVKRNRAEAIRRLVKMALKAGKPRD